jgi:hypothetical protein
VICLAITHSVATAPVRRFIFMQYGRYAQLNGILGYCVVGEPMRPRVAP